MAFTITVAEVIAADTTGLLAKHPSWERVSLAQVADILNGAPFDSAHFSNSEGMPLARIRDVLTGETSTYYTGPYEDTYVIRHGDLLIGMDGDFNSGFWGIRPALLNQRVCKITPTEEHYDKRLLSVALPGYLAAINANTPSVTVKHLSSKTIGEIELPLPPRAEQTRIVAKLEKLLSELDAGVAELKAAQKKLGHYRQSLLKAAVKGALTAEWRAQNASSETGAQLLERILTERRARWEAKQLAKFEEQGKTPPKDWQKKYAEPVRPDTSDLPGLPEGWVWTSLGESFQVAVGATPSRKEASYWNGAIPWVSSGEVRFNRIKDTKEKISEAGLSNSSTQINPVGSVLLGMIGEGKTRGQVAILDIAAANNQNCAAIWVSESGVPPEFVYCWLWSQYEQTRRGSSGNNQPALNKSIVERIPMPLPPLAEIQEIVRMVDATMEQIASQEEAVAQSLKQSTAQRQNILRAAFSGQLVPQDPNDEPASVLLERIRADRAARAKQPKPRKTKPKEIATMVSQLIDVLAEAGDWVPAQEAFRRCGVADGALTERIEELYAELRKLDKAGRLAVEAVTDAQGRKLSDKLKLLAG
jgi:type I restriction enzyme S subunit